jgi:hypothetical protein
LIARWIKVVPAKNLLSWSLGIRAIQVLRGKSFFLPIAIAKRVIEETSSRPEKDTHIEWMRRRAKLIVE